MRVEVSPEAAAMVRERGGRLWVWAARPPVCCWGTPAYLQAEYLTYWRSACGAGGDPASRPTGMAASWHSDSWPPAAAFEAVSGPS